MEQKQHGMQQQQYQGPERRQSQTLYQGDDRRKTDPLIDDPILNRAEANPGMSSQERKEEQQRIQQQQERHDDQH